MRSAGYSDTVSKNSVPLRPVVCIFICTVLLFGGFSTSGCRKRDNTAVLTFNVEDREFSEAEVLIDETPLGRLEQTIIKTNGELYINGQLTATLPPESPQVGKEDTYSGVMDSVTIKSGKHSIVFSAPGGKRLDISADVSPGYHLLTLAPSDGTLKWDNTTVKAVPGTTVTIPSR